MNRKAIKMKNGKQLKMKRKTFKVTAGALVAAVTLVACGSSAKSQGTSGAASAGQLTHVHLLLGFTMIGEYAPYALAVEDGIFKRNGLDVTIVEGQGSSTSARVIGAGTYPFGALDSTTAALAISKGISEKIVATFLGKSPNAVLTWSSEGITKPSQLIGMTLAANSGSLLSTFPAFLQANHLTSSQVHIETGTGHTTVALMSENHVPGILGLSNDEAQDLQDENPGRSFNTMLFADWGVPSVGPASIVVNNAYLQAHSNVVKEMTVAGQEAWAAALKDPTAAAKAAHTLFPLAKESVLLGQLNKSLALRATPNNAGKPWGYSDTIDWNGTLQVIKSYLNPSASLTNSDYYTNQYLDPSIK